MCVCGRGGRTSEGEQPDAQRARVRRPVLNDAAERRHERRRDGASRRAQVASGERPHRRHVHVAATAAVKARVPQFVAHKFFVEKCQRHCCQRRRGEFLLRRGVAKLVVDCNVFGLGGASRLEET